MAYRRSLARTPRLGTDRAAAASEEHPELSAGRGADERYRFRGPGRGIMGHDSDISFPHSQRRNSRALGHGRQRYRDGRNGRRVRGQQGFRPGWRRLDRPRPVARPSQHVPEASRGPSPGLPGATRRRQPFNRRQDIHTPPPGWRRSPVWRHRHRMGRPQSDPRHRRGPGRASLLEQTGPWTIQLRHLPSG